MRSYSLPAPPNIKLAHNLDVTELLLRKQVVRATSHRFIKYASWNIVTEALATSQLNNCKVIYSTWAWAHKPFRNRRWYRKQQS